MEGTVGGGGVAGGRKAGEGVTGVLTGLEPKPETPTGLIVEPAAGVEGGADGVAGAGVLGSLAPLLRLGGESIGESAPGEDRAEPVPLEHSSLLDSPEWSEPEFCEEEESEELLDELTRGGAALVAARRGLIGGPGATVVGGGGATVVGGGGATVGGATVAAAVGPFLPLGTRGLVIRVVTGAEVDGAIPWQAGVFFW